jgi:hypothetical protein
MMSPLVFLVIWTKIFELKKWQIILFPDGFMNIHEYLRIFMNIRRVNICKHTDFLRTNICEYLQTFIIIQS